MGVCVYIYIYIFIPAGRGARRRLPDDGLTRASSTQLPYMHNAQ